MSAPIFRGASRVLRSVPRQQHVSTISYGMARRCLSTMNVESQQKVREGSSAPIAQESAPANKAAEQQLLSAHLKEADPAMYEIIESVKMNPSSPGEDRVLDLGPGANCAGAYRRRRDKNTSSTSFHPRTSHPKPCWTHWAVLCKVRRLPPANQSKEEAYMVCYRQILRRLSRSEILRRQRVH